MSPKTLYDKIWDAHVAHEVDDGTCLRGTKDLMMAHCLSVKLALKD